MSRAVLAWIATFAFSAMLARGAAWRAAFQMTIPFPSYDDEAIYSRIKHRVFTRTWFNCAIVSSTSVAAAMLVGEVAMLLMVGCGVVLITAQTAIQGYKLFRVALLEMGLPWPPVTGP